MTTVTVQVDRPAAEVFAYATDPTKFHEWQQGVVSGKLESNGTPALGDRCLTVRRIGGAERPSTSELVRFDPPLAWSVRGIDGPIRARVDLTVEALSQSRGCPSPSTSKATASGGCWCRSSCAVKRAPRCPRTSPGSSNRPRLAP
jgi:hypothetical protein